MSRRKLVGALHHVRELLGYASSEPMQVYPTYLQPIPTDRTLAMDLEWARDGRVLGIGFAWRRDDGEIGVAFIAQPAPGDVDYVEHAILHNGMSRGGDIDKLAELGITLGRVDDTLLMAYSLRRDQVVGSLGLKELAGKDLGLSWETLTELGLPEDLEWEVLARYCLNDTIATLLLFEKYSLDMEEKKW